LVLDPNDKAIAETYNSIAMAFDVQNKFKNALYHFNEALRIYKMSGPSSIPYVAGTINNIGGVYDKVTRLIYLIIKNIKIFLEN